jgi:hypothetical protein
MIGCRRACAGTPVLKSLAALRPSAQGSAGRSGLSIPQNSQCCDDLRPNRNHAQKQCQTRNCSGFLNDSADHVSSPLNTK